MSKALPETKSEDDDVKNRAINFAFNFNSLIYNDVEYEIKFYTNNITESFNKQLNSNILVVLKLFSILNWH